MSDGENKTTSAPAPTPTTPATTPATTPPANLQVADTDVVYVAGPATCERTFKCEQTEQTVFVYCPYCWGTFCLWHATAHILYCKVHGPKKEGA